MEMEELMFFYCISGNSLIQKFSTDRGVTWPTPNRNVLGLGVPQTGQMSAVAYGNGFYSILTRNTQTGEVWYKDYPDKVNSSNWGNWTLVPDVTATYDPLLIRVSNSNVFLFGTFFPPS